MIDRRRYLIGLGAALCASRVIAAAPSELPGDSIYRLAAPLTDQDGRPFELASLRGHPVLASMFYSSCEMVCPLIFETMHRLVDALAPAERARVRLLMVSFDPERDNIAVLKKTAQAHDCGANWTLARAEAAQVRRIAAVLGVQYRRLDSGEYNHSASIALLDREGRIARRSGLLGSLDAPLLAALRAAAAG
ncbi:MAG: SCO family protein [Burkholderiales bacterium]|nr:SCO family protein [Burkholderiales bacterium]